MFNREQLVEYFSELKNFEGINSNIKFLTLLYSRLLEDGVTIPQAIFICGSVDADFSNVPEDDDTLSDIATEFSTYCVSVLNKIKLHGYLTDAKLPMFSSLFRHIKLEVIH